MAKLKSGQSIDQLLGLNLQNWFDVYVVSLLFGTKFGKETEPGVDVVTPFHTQLLAPYAGTVVEEGYHAYGGLIVVEQAAIPGIQNAAYKTLHLDVIDPSIHVGSHLVPGSILGLSGGETQAQVNAGMFPGAQHPVQNTKDVTYSTGPHTEFQILNDGQVVDPVSYLEQFTSDLPAGGAPAGQSNSGGPFGINLGSFLGLDNFNFKDFTFRTGLVIGGILVLLLALVMFVISFAEKSGGGQTVIQTATKAATA